MRISDWTSDVCSSDLPEGGQFRPQGFTQIKAKSLRRGINADAGAAAKSCAGTDDNDCASTLCGEALGEGIGDFGKALDIARDPEILLDPLGRGFADQQIMVPAAIGDDRLDRQGGVEGKRGSVRVDLGGRRLIIKKKYLI